MIIFSIGIISMPCAPFAFNFSMTFQKSLSLITECTELQPGSARGRIVGLFIPGSKLQILSSFSLGAFSNTVSEMRIVSSSFNSLVKRVLPELTRSQMASARPILGAISTEPLIWCIDALIFFLIK